MVEHTAAVLFGGIGGASVGYTRSKIEYGGKIHKFRLLCSIDYDPVACKNHDNITGENTAVVMDLFTREQYIDWHGKEPPPDWQEATPWDMWVAFGNQIPYFLFTSPPCKGLSALLPKESAESKKYQALNQLTLRGIELSLRACLEYGGGVPAFIQMENVPRILTRGKALLKKIEKLLKKFGYEVNMRADHNLGEIGGLGQNRVRFLILARHEGQVPNFVYIPQKKALKTIGDIIGPLPMPGDTETGGPLHRLPRLEWKTWVRLALIRAGGDWRDLQNIPYEQYRIVHEPRSGAWGVEDWNNTGRTVTSTAGPGRSNGVSALSDPRLSINGAGKANLYRVQPFDQAADCITGAVGPSNGAASISDPKLKHRDGRHPGVYRIVGPDETAPCVTGTRFGSGAIAVADPHFNKDIPKFNHSYKITGYEEVAGTVASGGGPSNGGIVVADPKVMTKLHPDSYGVQEWGSASKTVRSASRIMQSAASISDPRISDRPGRYTDKYRMQPIDQPAATVTGVTDVQSGAQLVADVRMNCSPRSGTMGVTAWEQTSPTVTGSSDIHAGSSAVADPRPVPVDTDRGVWIIIAEDGTWHRPLTTYELAMLQGFDTHLPDGRPFQLEGCSDAKSREYIGNAVPPASAEAMGKVILLAAAKAEANVGFELSWEEIWVDSDSVEVPVLIH
ncbi:DNA cytosine methyltransferase [Brevibacillus brevis]|uniref:DNA cytosine methyltransferase n=1 Tax=Brevibacillus brevis TaxID=1393 RepID=UPI001C8E8A6A|nr:DNA cytosine methyltransferase [Brevibacillus brevis]MBY0088432.1 DNA cytosine methyltransferase [Brevibacillus brevis]